jgi:hypothetical protein
MRKLTDPLVLQTRILLADRGRSAIEVKEHCNKIKDQIIGLRLKHCALEMERKILLTELNRVTQKMFEIEPQVNLLQLQLKRLGTVTDIQKI